MRVFKILISAMFILLVSLQAFAMDAEELIYLTEDYKLYSYIENNQMKGIAIDLLKLMWSEMGVPEQKIKFLPWARGYFALQTQPKTVLFATARTKERENLFKWVCPITTNKYVLIALKKRNIKINTLEDARKYRIGAIREDIAEQILLNANFQAGLGKEIDSVTRMEQNFRKIQVNRIDLIAYGENGVFEYINDLGLKPNDFETVFDLKESTICYAFHKNTEDQLIKKFQMALDAIGKKPILDTLLKQYFGQ